MMTPVHISFRHVAKLIVLCPILATFTCVLLAITLHFKESTRTHCKVSNVLPSISAAIGDHTPERYVWRLLIALHSTPRLIIAYMYHGHYQSRLTASKSGGLLATCLSNLILPLQVCENLALLGMSYVSSTENFSFHEGMFIVFVSCSMAHMVAAVYLTRTILSSSYTLISPRERKSAKLKGISLAINVLLLLLAVYFYYRHNTYCEPYVYSLFSLCEYGVVMTNMMFHFTAYWDFADMNVYVTTRELSKNS